ncbi:immunoglobulin kappa light chain-like [Vicugna pacos]|uniref:immunoglobulin kappa light chain-like n=1 Tax=Vicugna pacos TaxID=30538 RepID=UPI003BB8FEF0
MEAPAQLLCLLILWLPDNRAETVPTQSPALASATPGDKVTLTCKVSQDTDDDIMWYQQKPGQAPRLITKYDSTVISGLPSRFSGSGYGTDFTLTIDNMKSEDAAYYFCQQDDMWVTFGQGTKVELKRADAKPSTSIFPPAKEQLETESATIVCMVNNFYPKDISVKWKVDGVSQSSGVQTSISDQDSKDSTYSLSSYLTLSSSEYHQHNLYACEVTHKTLSSAEVRSFDRRHC